MIILAGIKSDYRVFDLITQNATGIISSVFRNSFNVLVRDELLTFSDVSNGYIPLGLLLDVKDSIGFKNMGLEPGKKVDLMSNMIIVKNILKIWLGNCTWCKTIIKGKSVNYVLLRKNLRIVEDILAKEKLGYGFNSIIKNINLIINHQDQEVIYVEQLKQKIIEILKNIFKGLGNNDPDFTIRNIKKLIGLGYGTTPSGDDILLGIITSFNYLGYSLPMDLTKTIKNDIKKKTTLVSAKYLTQAIEGNISGKLNNFLEALLFGLSEKELKKNIFDLIKVGASSGKEIILGSILAVNFFLK